MAVIMPIGGRFYNRLGPRLLVGAGLVITGISFWELSHLTSQIGAWDIFWPQVMQGVGFSLIFDSLVTCPTDECVVSVVRVDNHMGYSELRVETESHVSFD